MCLTPLDMLLSANKQWGKSTSTGEYVTHTFPIKFTVIPIVVAGALTSNTSGNTGSQSNPCYRSITVSNFVFCMYDNARGYAGSTYIAIGYQLQWGANLHGWVIFPIPFSQFRRLVTNHQGIVFMDSKAVESHSLSGFTLDVRNNNDSSEDAQWIAIGC